jgi:hypothetical protein
LLEAFRHDELTDPQDAVELAGLRERLVQEAELPDVIA